MRPRPPKTRIPTWENKPGQNSLSSPPCRSRSTPSASAQTLKTNPDDADANLAVGKYLCLSRNRWKVGLSYLAKGGDESLSTAADAELTAADTPAAASLRRSLVDSSRSGTR